MKKRIGALSISIAFAALSLGAASCEPEENATLVVRNDLGFDITELSLTGDADTGNLLGGNLPTILKDQTATIPTDVAPGDYIWHVKYANAPIAGEQANEEVELWPGLNHIVLSASPLL
jgi:hypothetical protein